MEKEIDIVALGELLIDFTEAGRSSSGKKLFEQNPGGAPANLLAVAAHMGYRTEFIGKVGTDMHGDFLKKTLKVEGIGTVSYTHRGLSFLGLGAKPPAAEWGSMMSDTRNLLATHPWVPFAPGIAIFVSVTVFNLLGEAVRDWLDPHSER